MREIKFRVWKDGKIYVYEPWMSINKVHISLDGVVWFLKQPGKANGENHDAILMQYTGLKDKNGKEIYEGDVISLGIITGSGQFPYDGETKERRVVVTWSEFRATWTAKFSESANNDLYRYINYGNTAEVIGNIYENPEFL